MSTLAPCTLQAMADQALFQMELVWTACDRATIFDSLPTICNAIIPHLNQIVVLFYFQILKVIGSMFQAPMSYLSTALTFIEACAT